MMLMIVGLGCIMACSAGSSGGGDRWSALPHTSTCSPTPSDRSASDGPIVLAQVPDEVRVKQVTLTHLGGQRMQVEIEFLQAPPPAPSRIPSPLGTGLVDAPGSISYRIQIVPHKSDDSVEAVLSIGSPIQGHDWKADGKNLNNSNKILEAVTTSSDTLKLTLDLDGQDSFFGGGPFEPYVSIVATGTGRPTSEAPLGLMFAFDAQECPWVRQSASSSMTAPNSGVPAAPKTIAGMVVMLDPALNDAGGNGTQVSDGRGGFTDCQRSGAAADSGYPERLLNWDVTLRVRQALTGLGVRSAMTRGKDVKSGDCVDTRASATNGLEVAPDAVISIRAYADPPAERGFLVRYADWPGGVNVEQATKDLGQKVYEQLAGANLPARLSEPVPERKSAYLNLVRFPAVEVLLGNMGNADDARRMETDAGRQEYADALVKGIVAFLQSRQR